MLFQSMPHQASFIKKELFDKNGKYDEMLKIKGDWAFTVREIIFNNCSIKHIPITICNYDLTGASSLNKTEGNKEKLELIKSFLSPRISADYVKLYDNYPNNIKMVWFKKHPFYYILFLLLYKIGNKLE